MKEQHLRVLKEMGFIIEGRDYEDIVAELIEEHIKLMLEIEKNNIKTFKDEIKRLYLPSN